MTVTIALCNTTWEVISFMGESHTPFLGEGDCLRELVAEGDTLPHPLDARTHMTLSFPDANIEASALIKPFPKGFLVVMAFGDDSGCDGALEMAELYEDAVAWARDHLDSIFRDEYYHIHMLNNQLVDSKRALARSNSRLHQALEELEQTNGELERAHKTAEQALELAERASRSKTAFLASVSHDIRTPLNAITGLIELTEHTGELSKRQQGYLNKMRSSSMHLLGIINDVLDISRIESGKLELSKESIDVAEQIEQVEAVISPQASGKGQVLAVDTGKLAATKVVGDGVRLRQVLTNLLSNAVKYTPEGGRIELVAENVACDKEGFAGLRLAVADNGCGMTPEFAAHVFDPFSREESAEGVQGTGLGMAITRDIVTAMGGTIGVETASGEGSRFTVELELPVDANPTASSVAAAADESASLEGLHLLAAEDNELNAEILKAMLAMNGAQCTVLSNGKEALDTFRNAVPGTFDAVLLDVQMPVMDGYATARALRALDRDDAREIPIIAMTANAFSEDARKCLDAGMDAHLSKSLDMGKLASVVAGLVENK